MLKSRICGKTFVNFSKCVLFFPHGGKQWSILQHTVFTSLLRGRFALVISVKTVTGLVPTIERRYRAQQMALWLDLIPRLHRAPNLGSTNFGSDECYHQLDDADHDSAFEQFAARVSDPDCSRRKQTPTVELPVGVTSFPVATRPSRTHSEHRRTSQSYVTPRYRW